MDTVTGMKDLHTIVIPHYTAKWKELGALLDIEYGELDGIEKNHPTSSANCCYEMLETWLCRDPTQSWHKLCSAIRRLSHGTDKATLARIAFNMIKDCSKHKQQYFYLDEWPQTEPEDCMYTPLQLSFSKRQNPAPSEEHTAGVDSEPINHSYQSETNDSEHDEAGKDDFATTTKIIGDILCPLEEKKNPQLILIEGDPGMGKSSLLQEILCRWANDQLLKKFKFVCYLPLRNPDVQKMKLLHQIFLPFFVSNRSQQEMAEECSEDICSDIGRGVVFLLDGYHEFPEALQQDSLIDKILSRELLQWSNIVVTSRPCSIEALQRKKKVDMTVEILGYDKMDRQRHIEKVLKGQPRHITKITKCLESHPKLDKLCSVPINMKILLYLVRHLNKQFPTNNLIELYKYFICLTICRYLAKRGYNLDNTIDTTFQNFPEPYNTGFKQLSEFSLKNITDNKFIFTNEDIQRDCPSAIDCQSKGNILGLLQAKEEKGLTGVMHRYKFVHGSVQEFLAALHIFQLPPENQIKVLRELFQNEHCSDMFATYIGFIAGCEKTQQATFKKFLSNDDCETIISENFLNNRPRCLHLFHCFHNTGDKEICKAIEESKTLNSQEFTFDKTETSDIEYIAFFLTKASTKQWELLNFSNSCIQDHSIRVLKHQLTNSVVITELTLNYNNLSQESSADICDIVIKCKVRKLGISGNHGIGENSALFSMLSHPSSVLESLAMSDTNLSSNATISLFERLKDGSKLKYLRINNNDGITDRVCNVVVDTLMNNTSLIELDMEKNQITATSMISILMKGLYHNNTLQHLSLNILKYPELDKEIIKSFQHYFNKTRTGRGSLIKLYIHV